MVDALDISTSGFELLSRFKVGDPIELLVLLLFLTPLFLLVSCNPFQPIDPLLLREVFGRKALALNSPVKLLTEIDFCDDAVLSFQLLLSDIS